MASLNREGTTWRIQFYDAAGKRQTLRLPAGIDKKGALAVKIRVEALLSARLAGIPMPQDVAQWLAGISDELHISVKLILDITIACKN